MNNKLGVKETSFEDEFFIATFEDDTTLVSFLDAGGMLEGTCAESNEKAFAKYGQESCLERMSQIVKALNEVSHEN